jgi:hypothetical protein
LSDGGPTTAAPPRGGALSPAVLAAAATLAALCVLAPLVHWAIAPTVLPPPLPEQNQSAETLLMVLAFAVLLPGALAGSLRLTPRVAAASGPRAPGALAALLAGALVLALLIVRGSSQLPWGYGLGTLLAAASAWWALSVVVVVRALRGWPPLGHPPPFIADRDGALVPAAGAVGIAVALALSIPASVDIAVVVILALVAAAIAAGYGRIRLPALGRPWGAFADAMVVVLLVLAVVNVVIFVAEDPTQAFANRIIQFHQDFFLGPANHVLGGEPMLVGTYSQYGVTSIYLIAGWFHIAPQGNGTLGFLDGFLQGCVFAAGYGVLRLARVPRTLATGALLVGVLVLVLSLAYPVGALLQHGAIRFGMPMLVVLLATLSARFPGRSGVLRGAILVVVAIASTWALEAFAYTLLTVASLIALDVAAAEPRDRRRRAIKGLAACVLAVLAGQVAFALITLAAVGELPNWGHYLTILREFLTGGIGDLTYDFAPWSPGLAVGALYVASAAGIVAVIVRRRDLLVGEPALLAALTGTTAYGIALFTYLDNRSAPHIVAFVSLPALLAATLWIALALRPGSPLRLPARRSVLAAALGASAVMVAAGASSIPTRWEGSALAHVLPGGDSLPTALRRLWHPPPFEPGVDQGVALLDSDMPGPKPIVMTSADLGIEILAKSQRSNAVPLGDPWEDSFVPDQHLDELGAFADSLEAGDRILVDRPAIEAFRAYRAQPERDPIENPLGGGEIVPTGVAALQQWLLKEIGTRFDLEAVAGADDGSGVSVVELVPRD